MAKIIKFPSTEIVREFYRFTMKYSDGVIIKGDSYEELFRKQKDLFEPEISMREYTERLRDRLLVIYGKFYEFKTYDELIEILKEKELIELIES